MKNFKRPLDLAIRRPLVTFKKAVDRTVEAEAKMQNI